MKKLRTEIIRVYNEPLFTSTAPAAASLCVVLAELVALAAVKYCVPAYTLRLDDISTVESTLLLDDVKLVVAPAGAWAVVYWQRPSVVPV